MHADEMEDIESAGPGDIVAIFGLDCHSGDTFTDGKLNVAMTSIHVPAPVISLSVKPVDNKSQINLTKALQRFTKEDPTFRAGADPESGETVIHGMGELQLEVYIERMKREYNVEVEVSPPQVAYRETISQRVDFDYTHKKQTGGSGQYGRVAGYIEPNPDAEFEFVDEIKGGAIPRQFIPSVEKGHEVDARKGPQDRRAGRERARRHQRRQQPFRGLVRRRVPGSGPRRMARSLRPRQAADPRADHARGRGRADRARRRRAHDADAATRHHHRPAGERWL